MLYFYLPCVIIVVMSIEKQGAEAVRQGSMEGNVRMPQTFSAMRLFTLERIFKESNPAEAMSALLAPLPINEEMIDLAKKANAQHAAYGIARVITPEGARDIRMQGNLQVLWALEVIFDITKGRTGVWAPLVMDEKGSWASSERKKLLETIQKRFNDLEKEDKEFLSTVFAFITQVLREPEGVELLKKRSGAFKGYSAMDDSEKKQTRSSVDEGTKSIQEYILAKLKVFREKTERTGVQETFLKRIEKVISFD